MEDYIFFNMHMLHGLRLSLQLFVTATLTTMSKNKFGKKSYINIDYVTFCNMSLSLELFNQHSRGWRASSQAKFIFIFANTPRCFVYATLSSICLVVKKVVSKTTLYLQVRSSLWKLSSASLPRYRQCLHY